MILEPIQDDLVATRSVPEPRQARELDLFAFFLLLLRHGRFIAGTGIVCFLVMVGVMLHDKPRYASTSVMIIPQGNVTSANLSAKLALSTTDLLGGGYELYADILKSHRVTDPLIQQYHLQEVYHSRQLDDAEITLETLTKVLTSREGVIRVTVQDTDPNRAAALANGYLTELDLVNQELVLTSVGQQAKFLKRETESEQRALSDAEVALKESQISTGGLAPDVQANAGLTALVTTRAQLRAEQIKLDSLLLSETNENPEVIRLRAEIAGLNSQVSALQSGSVSSENGIPISQVPAQTLEYTRRLREVKFHETLFELLAKEYEAAKQEEAKNPSIVQVLDTAVPSYKKAWPPRTYYCLAALVVGLLAAIFLVSVKAFALAYIHHPRNAAKVEEIKSLYRRRRRA